jgi:predicted ATPase/DNA-binding SARP family transcriptional activator
VTDSESAAIEFRLLGPVEAVRNGSALPLGGPRQRTLLALLLIARGRRVPAGELVEELWHGAPPAGASTTLPSYVSRLRATIAEGAAITGDTSGYALDVALERVDALQFERLIAEGREALERGAVRRAAKRLGAAQALWRGRPFGGTEEEGALRVEADRLEELRLVAVEARIEADLALGMAGDLIEELEALVVEHPYRERFWQQLMLALYRAQRQAEALAAYRRARTIFDEELGLEPGAELKALEQAILRHEIAPVQPPEERHNLPAPLTSFVGRQAELADIERLLGRTRLLTLTGVGGVGKTRLALEAGRRALPELPDGAWFCDFSAVGDADLVPRAIATALEISEPDEGGIVDELVGRLREAEALLLLDNCEHLREPIAELAHVLLAASPRLHVLATSREPLVAPGEVDYPVPPLALPEHGAGPDAHASSEAVQLFLERVQAAQPRLTADEETIATAARICLDVDGLPLAIELAAARAKALSLEEIAVRLADRFRFLVSWRRLAPARHRTLRATMDWSWELLSREERSLLADLSAFAGGFTLSAVAVICTDGDEERALALVERLVEASLLVVGSHEGATRYHLLETVRQYATERLADSGATAETRERHACYFLELAEQHSRNIYERGTFARTELYPDDANLRAALRRFRESGPAEDELRMCAALWRHWWMRGELAEGRQLLRAALERGSRVPTGARAEALRGASMLALRQGDRAAAAALAEEGVEVSAKLGGLELARTRVALANAAGSLGELDRAERLYEESAAAFRAGDSRWELLNVLINMADLALGRGDLEAAERITTESLTLSRALGEEAGVAPNLVNLAFIAIERGGADGACALLVEALELTQAVGFAEWVAIMLVGLAAVAMLRHADRRAAELLGAAERLLDEVGASLDSIERQVHARTLATLRERMGEDAFATSVESGRRLSAADAIDLATSA